jgi:hypothetical protein
MGDGTRDLIDAFLERYERVRTREAYGHDLRDFFGDEVTDTDEAISREPADICGYLQRAKETSGPSSARRRSVALRRFYRWLKEKQGASPLSSRMLIRATKHFRQPRWTRAPLLPLASEIIFDGRSSDYIREVIPLAEEDWISNLDSNQRSE